MIIQENQEKSSKASSLSTSRPSGYQYFNILSNHLNNDLTKIFNGQLIYPRQLEIHLPGDHKQPCNFNCYYCQGKLLEQPLADYENDALKIVDDLQGKIPYFIYGGAYSEPMLNPSFLDFLKLTKKHGSYFGIHTNGSMLKPLEESNNLLSEMCRIATSNQDYLSVSLDAGSPESHMRSKGLDVDWFTEIIEGIRMAVSIRGKNNSPAIRVCYLMNSFNSSERELNGIVNIMRDIGVDSLRFSIPYDLYGKDFSKVKHYKETIETEQNNSYIRLLNPLLSHNTEERPYIFYIPPECQDVDKMNFQQCIYSYYQITFAADGYVYKCSSTATPTFKMNRLGEIPHTLEQFDEMVLANHNPDFCASTCFGVGARCNRMALEINTAWAGRNGKD